MEALVQSILVNVAVCLYGTLGFCLSVVASLLSLFGVKQPTPINVPQKRPRLQHRGPSCRPTDRIIRICSEKSVLEQEKRASDISLQNRRKLLASHRRSRSIPVITVDYFGSTDNLRQKTDENQSSTKGVRKPLTFVIPPAPDRQPTIASQSEKPVFRLVNLFSKEKENKHNNREKKLSSPDITRDSATLLAPRRRYLSDVNTVPLSPTDSLEQKPRKPVRRISSAPAHAEEKLTMKFDLTFTRSVEKKKSPILRTQPYEAPFFCSPPTLPRRSASTTDLTSTKKPSRSWTMK